MLGSPPPPPPPPSLSSDTVYSATRALGGAVARAEVHLHSLFAAASAARLQHRVQVVSAQGLLLARGREGLAHDLVHVQRVHHREAREPLHDLGRCHLLLLLQGDGAVLRREQPRARAQPVARAAAEEHRVEQPHVALHLAAVLAHGRRQRPRRPPRGWLSILLASMVACAAFDPCDPPRGALQNKQAPAPIQFTGRELAAFGSMILFFQKKKIEVKKTNSR